jgi:hypothetical protein
VLAENICSTCPAHPRAPWSARAQRPRRMLQQQAAGCNGAAYRERVRLLHSLLTPTYRRLERRLPPAERRPRVSPASARPPDCPNMGARSVLCAQHACVWGGGPRPDGSAGSAASRGTMSSPSQERPSCSAAVRVSGRRPPQSGLGCRERRAHAASLADRIDPAGTAVTSIAGSSESSANLYSSLAAIFFGSFPACCDPACCDTVSRPARLQSSAMFQPPAMLQYSASVHCRRALG